MANTSANINGDVTSILSGLTPDVFNNTPYISRKVENWNFDKLEETDNLIKSGIESQATQGEQDLLNNPGYSIQIPHVTAIDAGLMPQRLSADNDIIGNRDGKTYNEYEIKALEAQSYNFSEVDKYISGVNQEANVLAQMAQYWGHVDEQRLIKVLHSTFKNPEIANAKGYHLGDMGVSGLNGAAGEQPRQLTNTDFMLANSRMGDNNLNSLTKVVMNSATYWYMRAQDTLNNYIQVPSKAGNGFSTYQGFDIIVDDSIPVHQDGTTEIFLFGGGAVKYVTMPFPGDGASLTQNYNQNGGVLQYTEKRIVTCHVNGTSVDPALMEQGGFQENDWDKALWSEKPLFKPTNPQTLRDMNIVKMDCKIDTNAIDPGVNTQDSNGDILGDDGSGQHKSNGSNNSGSASNNAPKSSTTKSK